MDELFDETLEDIETLATAIPYLYVLYAEGSHWIKVGHSFDVRFRMQSLQGGNPLRLRVLFAMQRPDAAQVEEVLKAHLSPYKMEGEWFALPEDVPTALSIIAFIMEQSHTEVGDYTLRSKPALRRTLMETQIVTALEEQPRKITDLMRRIGVEQSRYGFMRKILSRLYRDDKIEKTRQGVYCSKSYKKKGDI